MGGTASDRSFPMGAFGAVRLWGTSQPSAFMSSILEAQSVASWLREVELLDPQAKRVMGYMVDLYNSKIIRVETYAEVLVSAVVMTATFGLGGFSPAFQGTYSRLRDWLKMPCPQLEEWMASNVLPLHADLSKSLNYISPPQTILDTEVVKAWFARAQDLDKAFCITLKRLIRARSLGFGHPSPIPKQAVVRPPHLLHSPDRRDRAEPTAVNRTCSIFCTRT